MPPVLSPLQRLRPLTLPALALALIASAGLPGEAQAQTQGAAKPAAQPAAKPVAKAGAKPAAKPDNSPSRVELRSNASQLAAAVIAAERALTPEELAVAEQVHVGPLPCELGARVQVTADARSPGYFDVEHGRHRYRMFPVPTTTGAIRLEDPQRGAVWLQLANKSMLMNQKVGRREADDCKSPAQAAVAEALARNPGASLLDGPSKPAPAAAPTQAAAAAPTPVATPVVTQVATPVGTPVTPPAAAPAAAPAQ